MCGRAISTPAGALAAGLVTFSLVVLAVAAYGAEAQDACVTEAESPVGEAWSGSQRLTWWPPAAIHCEWTTAGEPSVTATITAWPLWLVYAAVAISALLAVRRWAMAMR